MNRVTLGFNWSQSALQSVNIKPMSLNRSEQAAALSGVTATSIVLAFGIAVT